MRFTELIRLQTERIFRKYAAKMLLPAMLPVTRTPGLSQAKPTWPIIIWLLVLCCSGCQRQSIQIQLESSPGPESSGFVIKAVSSDPLPDLEYVWFAQSGKCDPQRSSKPATLFHFAEGATEDRVTAEVWKNGQRLTLAHIQIKRPDGLNSLPTISPSDVRVEITQVPLAAPGGPETRTDIKGTVSGVVGTGYCVIVYAYSDGVWYVQPESKSTHPIDNKQAWHTWTHSGMAYAVLVVRGGFVPTRTLNEIPPIGNEILARTVVDGRKP
jgi:hypothetical protein